MDTNTTRRNLLHVATSAAAYASGAVILGGGIALASEAHGTTTEAAEWDRALAEMNRLKAVYDAADDALTEASIKADRIRPPETMVPHDAIGIQGNRWSFHAADADKREHNWRAAEGKTWWSTNDSKQRTIDAFAKLREWQRLDRAAEALHNVGPLSERADAACDAWVASTTGLMEMPAPHLPALLWKMREIIVDESGSTPSWSYRYVEQMMRDAARLLGGEA